MPPSPASRLLQIDVRRICIVEPKPCRSRLAGDGAHENAAAGMKNGHPIHRRAHFFYSPPVAPGVVPDAYGLTLSLSDLPGLNATVLLALIFTGSPVCGFLPVRAPRWRCRKVPKPTRVTLSLRCRAPVISSRTALRTRLACSLVRSAFSAMAAASSGLRISEASLTVFCCYVRAAL